MLALQRDIAIELGASSNLETAFHSLSKHILSLEDIDVTAIYLRSKNEGSNLIAYGGDVPEDILKNIQHYPADSLQAKIVEEGKIRYMPPEEIAGTLQDKQYFKEMKTIGIIPIKKEDGEVIASFVVFSFTQEGIAEDTKIVLESIASQIGNLILRLSSENTLKKSESKFKNYINNAPDGIFVADENGNYIEVNTAACETTGYSQEELLSMNLIYLIPPEDHEKVTEAFRTVVKKGFVDAEFHFIKKDGSRRWWRVTSTKLSDTRYLGFTKDTTESKLMEEELIESKLFLNSIIESINDGVSILDADLNIIRVNNTMNKWFARNTPLEGKKCYEAYHDRDSPCKTCPIMRCMETGETERNIVQGLPDSEAQWFELLGYPLKDPTTGEITGVVEFVNDITDHKLAEEELAEARLHAREVSKTNSELKVNLSRELRTPLGNIIGFSQIFQNDIYGKLNPKQQKHIQGIQKSAEQLMGLIDDILEISDVEAGKMELNIEMVSIPGLLNEILKFLKPFAEDRNVEITTDIPEYLPEISVDKVKIKQAIYNLIINAIHFTPEGRDVHISMEYSSYDLRFEVNDSGIGISPSHLEELFRPFKEIYSESGMKPHDSILSLSLAKEYIELHGGEIEVESEPGAGNSYIFTIPIQPI
ncbi:PAS domain S-box protein [Methanohalophilus profundi]|uniref:PAS domain S-box protein n=1 Tax=Methanohalophilus profundi TaxID=2138083 RepID=UPI00101CC0DA|nr:PAS domain S-box protein [Methanohalophilus profundi]